MAPLYVHSDLKLAGLRGLEAHTVYVCPRTHNWMSIVVAVTEASLDVWFMGAITFNIYYKVNVGGDFKDMEYITYKFVDAVL